MRRSRGLLLVACLLIGGIVASFVPLWNDANAANDAWSQVTSPNPSTNYNRLLAISASNADLAWAVGWYNDNDAQPLKTRALTVRWNGTNWINDSNPVVGTSDYLLSGVSTVPSADTAWAVGYSGTTEDQATLIEFWNGTSWSVVSSPNVTGARINRLHAVTAIGSNSALAVGYWAYNKDQAHNALILRWNGTQWSIVTDLFQGGELFAVSALDADNMWAVGYYQSSPDETLIQYSANGGSSWTRQTSPNAGTGDNSLAGVTAIDSDDVRAVGHYFDGGVRKTLTERWNGTSWNVVSSPSPVRIVD